MNKFEIINETKEEIKEIKIIDKLISFALNYLNIENAVLNIIIVDNETIHKINKEYRNIDRPTDVISFALEDNKDFIDIGYRILGDIYISIDKVREQSINYNHSFLRELSFLSIHGLLHLLGYDHMNEEDEKEMFHLQDVILDEIVPKKTHK